MQYAKSGKFLQAMVATLLMEGEVAQITGTDLTIAVKAVKDFTGEGCLGGPVGCPDHVQLEVTQANASRQIILYVARTAMQKEQNVNRTKIFGHEITLISLEKKHAVLNIGD